MFVSRPGANRQNESLRMDILEACIFQVLLKLRARRRFYTIFTGSFDVLVVAFLDFTTVKATVRTCPLEIEVDELYVAAWLCIATSVSRILRHVLFEKLKNILEAMLGQAIPISDSGPHKPAMDEIE